jgi:hypothetical protein
MMVSDEETCAKLHQAHKYKPCQKQTTINHNQTQRKAKVVKGNKQLQGMEVFNQMMTRMMKWFQGRLVRM